MMMMNKIFYFSLMTLILIAWVGPEGRGDEDANYGVWHLVNGHQYCNGCEGDWDFWYNDVLRINCEIVVTGQVQGFDNSIKWEAWTQFGQSLGYEEVITQFGGTSGSPGRYDEHSFPEEEEKTPFQLSAELGCAFPDFITGKFTCNGDANESFTGYWISEYPSAPPPGGFQPPI